MKKGICLILFLGFFVGPMSSFASLIGDTVSIDRRYNDFITSTRTTTVSSAIEIYNWQNIYFDFYDYGVKMIPASTIGYAGSDFNGFDFYDLDFGAENEIISSVTGYYVSILDGTVTQLDVNRLSYSDHAFSLDMSWSGFGSSPLYIDIETKVSAVPEPPTVVCLFSGVLFFSFLLIKNNRNTGDRLKFGFA